MNAIARPRTKNVGGTAWCHRYAVNETAILAAQDGRGER